MTLGCGAGIRPRPLLPPPIPEEIDVAAPDYRALAAQAHDDAAAANLTNVRDRFLRAESAWLAMARRQDLSDAARAKRDATDADKNDAIAPLS